MTRPEQTRKELELAALAARRIPGLRVHRLTPLVPPEPDCLIEAGGAVYGVEITEFRGNQRLRHAEAAQELVVSTAIDLSAQLSFERASVAVIWRNSFVPRRRATTARQLVSVAQRHLRRRPVTLGPNAHQIEGVLEILISPSTDTPALFYSVWHWSAGLLSYDDIQHELARKASRPAAYRQSYSERWLLLVYGGRGPSNGADVPLSVLRRKYYSAFDRVYFYSLAPAFLRRLPTVRV